MGGRGWVCSHLQKEGSQGHTGHEGKWFRGSGRQPGFSANVAVYLSSMYLKDEDVRKKFLGIKSKLNKDPSYIKSGHELTKTSPMTSTTSNDCGTRCPPEWDVVF